MSKNFLHDLHTHTRFSDGRNTVWENVRIGEAVGLHTLGITDHIFDAEELPWIDEMLNEVRKANASSSLKILAGIETAILNPQGEIPLPEEIAKKLDIILADFSWKTKGIGKDIPKRKATFLENVRIAYLKVLENPVVEIVSHPFNLGRFFPGITIKDLPRSLLEEIASSFQENSKIFEIMNQMPWWFPGSPVKSFTSDYLSLLEVFVGKGIGFSLGSDAHSCGAVGNLRWCKKIVRELGIEKLIVNTEK